MRRYETHKGDGADEGDGGGNENGGDGENEDSQFCDGDAEALCALFSY